MGHREVTLLGMNDESGSVVSFSLHDRHSLTSDGWRQSPTRSIIESGHVGLGWPRRPGMTRNEL